MAKRDFYDVLGVPKNAPADEVKRAYRRLARQYHPDVNKAKDAESKFKELQEAYDVVSDDNKRAQYDQFGHAGMEGFGAGGGGQGGFDFGGFQEGFGDVFDAFFGGSGARRGGRGGASRGPARGSDLRYDLTITLEEAFNGVEKELQIPHLVKCAPCSGTGAKPGTKPTICSTCNGQGAVRREQRTLLGNFATTVTCPNCGGKGSVIASPCTACRGAGVERKGERVRVKIPPGVDTGSRIRVSGAGDSGMNGGQAGDLYIYISVASHAHFKRDDDDLFTIVHASIVQAALGAEVEVPTIDGKVKLKIPAGTQSHTTFRLRDRGMPHLQGRTRGSLNIQVEVVTPTGLTREQKDLLQQFGKLRGE